MFLKRLAEYADQIGMPPPLYQERRIRYIIQLTLEGTHPNIVDCGSPESKRGLAMVVPSVKRNKKFPYLLADTAEYVLGFVNKGVKEGAVQEKHAAFVEIINDCALKTQEVSVQAIAHFYATYDLSCLLLPADFDSLASLTFEVGMSGVRPVDLPSVRAYWASVAAVGDEANSMQCLVCGNVRPAVKRLPIAIRGIPGGQTSGMSLIAADKDAYMSYGQFASLNAPTCEECGQRFGNALNTLLKEDTTHYNTGLLSYIFWSNDPRAHSAKTLLSYPTEETVHALLGLPYMGRDDTDYLDQPPFYAAVLSATGTRVVLRDWMETTLSRVQTSLAYYFALQRIIDGHGKERWFSISSLSDATVRRNSNEKAVAQVGQAFLHFAFYSGVLPVSLLYFVLRSVRSEHDLYPVQAGCIKMVLLSQPDISWIGTSSLDTKNERMTQMVECDTSCPDPAYLCGRLLAVLESIQYAAQGDVNATIVDRYYGTASSAPASAFGRLLRGVHSHLSKLERDKFGAFKRLETQLQEILDQFQENAFPSTLNLLAQGRFALGYYHQKSADRRAMEAAVKNKKMTKNTTEEQTALLIEVEDERGL